MRILLLIVLFANVANACDTVTRLYGAATTVDFCLYVTDSTVGAVKVENAVHASGDTYIMKDEGPEANTTNGFVDEGSCYSIALTATEMQAARILLNIEDQGTKTWADKCIRIETYGHPSAQHNAAFPANITQVAGTNVPTPPSAGYLPVTVKPGTGTGEISLAAGAVTVATNNDKTGYGLADNAITAAKINTGAITNAKFAAGAIDAAAIASNAITDAKINTGAITSAKFASGAITSTVLAADSIGSSQLATSAVDEIVDANWDEATSGHTTAGTTGKALIDAGTAGNPWSAATASNNTPGTFGAALGGGCGGVTSNSYGGQGN
jgi:hypothetical protein